MNTTEHPIRRIRKRLNLSQEAAATALGVTQTTWSKYERGDVDLPLDKARGLIRLALSNRLTIDLNHVYEDIPLPPARDEP